MNKLRQQAAWAAAIAALVSTMGCANMDARDRSTATGAVIGGAAGAVLGDSTAATLGGAAIGGVIGNQVGKNKDK